MKRSIVKKTCLSLAAILWLAVPFAGATTADDVVAAWAYVPGKGTLSGDLTVERIPLTADVAHYRFEIPVGAGGHERVRLHRIVREQAPYLPAPAPRAVLMAHGDRWGFEPTFLLPADRSLAVFLAENGIDVWGIDFRWTLVPEDEPDLSFMFEWGLDTDAADLGVALAAARGVRLATGSGFDPIHLAGFSRGGHAAYVYLSGETQLPPALRQVRGFIALDIAIKSDDEGVRQRACQRYANTLARIAAGQQVASTTIFRFLADLAVAAPDDPSPFFPGFTNRQLALDVGTFPDEFGFVPFFHAMGGVLDENLIPQGLAYSTESDWFAFLRDQAIHQPRKVLLQAEAVLCGEIDTPLDDHLAEVAVPVLYVGAGGGFGEFGVFNTTILGSTDVSAVVVSLDEDRRVDVAHQELFLADDAESLFWQPILDWIEGH